MIGRCDEGRRALTLLYIASWLGGCAMIGPDYEPPRRRRQARAVESADPGVETQSGRLRRLVDVFDDPALDALVDSAYRQNLSLQPPGCA